MLRIDTLARRAPALALAVTLFASALGPPTPVGLAAPPAELAARLQIVLKQFTIHDEREGFLSGNGEIVYTAGIWRCNEGIPPPCSLEPGDSKYLPTVYPEAAPIVRAGGIFNAGKGETITLDREVPGAGDVMWGGNTAPELGFAVYPGQRYVLHVELEELDDGCSSSCDDYMGQVFHFLEIGGLGMGTHTLRSRREDGVTNGDFTVTYEVRSLPFPDVEPIKIAIQDLPGRVEKHVCMTVVNWGPGHASAFQVTLRVNGIVPPDGRYTVGVLAAKTDYLTCVKAILPTAGQYRLTAVADESRTLTERDESNNVYEQASSAAPPPAVPSAAQADLTVSAIRVNGQVPDGKNDCKAGKNDVVVTVKNAGAGDAGPFAVRLTVDGDDAGEALTSAFAAGNEWEARFDDVRLKQGDRQLRVVVDATSAVAESNEANNELKVTARCQGGS